MNVQLLINRVLADPMSRIQPSEVLTQSEIDKDPYLIVAYYFHSPYIRLVTMAHLLSDTIGGRPFPKVRRTEDIPDYAFDMICEQGRALLFLEPGSGYGILKQLDTKRFLTFGRQRSVPFGMTNFIQPIPNALNISTPFTFGKPILIVEGLRDCLDAQMIYPYTLAMQTDGIPSMIKEVLKTLTNTIIIGLDNDESGIRGKTNLLKRHEFDYKQIEYPDGRKDIGTLSQLYLKDTFAYEYFKTSLTLQLQILAN